ncbi:H(+)/Cl(-) exchange transporter 6-like [Haliotis cracherodii]|uniref:H(+)/Cl(-) exchange transporter 6-like n=1 Tax=Haliotis cracherodii TaxID=6455 RepID=UPI0039E85D28
MASTSWPVGARDRLRTAESGTGDTEERTPLLPSRQPTLLTKDFESLDYDRCFNEPYELLLKRQQQEHSDNKIEAIKWIITFLVGLLTGMVALYIDSIVKLLSHWKFNTIDVSIQKCSKEGCLVESLLFLLMFNVGFVIIAACLTVYEPVAGGSGIPEIKCYLNGIKVPRVARFATLLAKSIGVLFSVAGGLFVGKEGPMIHSGAIIGAGVPQFQSLAFRKINIRKYAFFRTDRDKRDFVSGGAAAGVAAAFGAPIGGVLFSLEEGCSFWNQKLTWRTFFCSMAATFSLNFFLSGLDSRDWGYFYLPGLINFGEFKCQSEESGGCHLWNAVDLLIFIVMGFVGGLLGALFNVFNKALTVHRIKYCHTKHKIFKILEAVLVAMVTTTVAFTAAMTLGECSPLTVEGHLNVSLEENVETTVRTYFCEDGYYNDMATLFFNSQEVAIKQLFHQAGRFSMPSLWIFFVCFFMLACWTYGVTVPSGLFVPCLLCGAAYGRIVGNLLENYIGYKTIYSGTFALIGAASFLGGVVRMTISLTVILIESTNEISYGMPLMITLMVAKWSGDLFNEGLYDIHIKLRGVPLLEWEAPTRSYTLKAKDVMSKKLSVIFPHTRVSTLIRILKTTVYNALPVVTMPRPSDKIHIESDIEQDDKGDCLNQPQDGHRDNMYEMMVKVLPMKFTGIILRSQLVMLLKKGGASPGGEDQETSFSYEELTEDYPRYPDVQDLDMSTINPEDILDVRRYMNTCPYTVFADTALPQVFNLFRSMGLRHLPVIDHQGKLVGMITRHNLTHHYLEEELHRQGNNR